MTLDELLLVRDVLERVMLVTDEGEKNRKEALQTIYREIDLKTMDPRFEDTNERLRPGT